jgi:hypothetical protein
VSRDGDEWATRLADVHGPSWYGLGLVVLLIARLVRDPLEKRDWAKAEASVREAATVLAERMAEGDKRDDRMAELTESIAAMTKRTDSFGRTSVNLAAALAVAVVVAVVGRT